MKMKINYAETESNIRKKVKEVKDWQNTWTFLWDDLGGQNCTRGRYTDENPSGRKENYFITE